MVRESHNNGLSGLPMALTLLTVSALALYGVITGVRDGNPTLIIASSIALVLALFLLGGLFMVNPNEGRVLQLFGDYAGTARRPDCAGRTRSIRRSASPCACATSRARGSR